MRKAIFFDTETTGLPDWKAPSDAPQQPHLVQLGALQVDLDTRKIIQSLDVIIKPESWEIPSEVAEVHGITNEKASEVGIPETVALEAFLAMCKDSLRIAHNRTFDQRIIRIACKRYSSESVQEDWADKENFDCTMMMAKPIMMMEPKGRFGYKQPKLEEAYKFFTGKDLVNAHTAMADTTACMEVYFAMLDFETSSEESVSEDTEQHF